MDLNKILIENGLKNAIILGENYKGVFEHSLWNELLKTNEIVNRKEIVLKYWLIYKERLTRTYTLLENNLKDVFIVQHLNEFKIVYIFEINNEVLIYEGNEPITESAFLKNLPEDIRAYYMNVHNGWYESLSGALGFLPLDKIEFLDESEWGILEEIKILDIDLNKTYYLFHNAGTGYLCVDIEKSVDEPKYLIWWTNKEPKYDIDFWSFFDAWIEIGLTN